VSVEGKSDRKVIRYDKERRVNPNSCRRVVKLKIDIKTRVVSVFWDQFAGQSESCASGVRRIVGVNLYWAFLGNYGNQSS